MTTSSIWSAIKATSTSSRPRPSPGGPEVDSRQLLTTTMARSYARLRARVEGLTDEEFFWQPIPDSWTIYEDKPGHWTYHYAIPEPDPGVAAPRNRPNHARERSPCHARCPARRTAQDELGRPLAGLEDLYDDGRPRRLPRRGDRLSTRPLLLELA
ncbi:MAG: DinB family protein [Chloroflexi bacterium]|nr:MAG: DinB family protein [Chloroflexota bacterium]